MSSADAPDPVMPSGRVGDFWRFWAASVISGIGSAVTAVVLPLVAVTTLSAAPTAVGLLTAATYVVGLLLGLPAGAVVGRHRLRHTQVLMDLLRGAVVATVPIAWSLGLLTIWQLVIVAAIVSGATVIFEVASSTFLPAVVPPEELQHRNSLISGAFSASLLLGPTVAGLAMAVAVPVAAVWVDVASYLAS